MPQWKRCLLCQMARPSQEIRCGVCGNTQYGEMVEGPPADLAERLIAEDRFAVAYACLEEQVSRGEESAWGCRALAWMAFGLGDLRAVEAWSHESIRLDSSSPEPHILLGCVLENSARWVEAVEEFDIALRREQLGAERRELVEELKLRSSSRIPEF